MFLKSIEIFGFKSFADKSLIQFSDGVSALLGPNGCGKSNVVDAIKWVLGEQATKSLRADKMEDVIFNGTEARKALNVAEVTLTLQNDHNLLPLDMPEVSVKRRLYRNGDSEYYINNTPVRLKELRELFYDTGVGKSAYSIMEQGKIDQVLSNKPEERRLIFEEAAAITKFKVRGQEAERKLLRTEENMRQVESILSEVKRSYDALKKQSEKTVRYRELKDETFSVELSIQLLKLRDLLEAKDKRNKELAVAAKERDELKHRIDTINESVESNLDQVNTMESELIETQKLLYGIELEKNNLTSQISLLQERGQEISDKLKSDKETEAVISKRIEEVQNTILEKEKSEKAMESRVQENQQNIQSFAASITRTSDRITDNQQGIDSSTREIHTIEAEQTRLQESLAELTDDIVAQLDQGLQQSGYSIKRREELSEDFHGRLQGIRIAVQGKRDLLSDFAGTGEVEGLQDRIRGLIESLSDIDGKIADLDHVYTQLEETIPRFLDDFIAPEGIITRKRGIDERMRSLRHEIENHRERITNFTEENDSLRKKVEEYRRTLEDLKLSDVQLKNQVASIREDINRTRTQTEEMYTRLREHRKQMAEDEGRLQGLSNKIKEVESQRLSQEKEEKNLQKTLSRLEKTISTKNAEMIRKEKELKTSMTGLGKAQAKVEKLQMTLAEISADIKNLYNNFRERYSQELSTYEDRIYEITDSIQELKKNMDTLKEEQKSLGSVNLMAPEEFAEVKERYEFLRGQMDDLAQAKSDLERITSEIRQESAELFTQTYEKIRKNFHAMFRRLFGGGRAEIRLTEPDRVLESGIEIFAQPPGKKLESINLLSGGERSLTAVALLFATYMVKPSPFCLLDEIDAALDESNVGRFVTMLMEFGQSSQFIVITHNKKTVAGARTLLGVTMEESGVSKVVSIRIGGEGEVTTPDQNLHRG